MKTLLHNYLRKRDFYAGALMVLLGIGTVVQAQFYKMGTLTRMGPGQMPWAAKRPTSSTATRTLPPRCCTSAVPGRAGTT